MMKQYIKEGIINYSSEGLKCMQACRWTSITKGTVNMEVL
jgi:hypothetical protein